MRPIYMDLGGQLLEAPTVTGPGLGPMFVWTCGAGQWRLD